MTEVNKAPLNYALFLLSLSDRSEKNLFDKISKKFDVASAKTVVKYLVEQNIINDARYAKNLVDYYLKVRKFGANRIKLELIKKGLPRELIEKEMSGIDEEVESNECKEYLESLKKRQNLGEVDFKMKNKLLSKLGRRGYSYSVAKEALEELLKNSP